MVKAKTASPPTRTLLVETKTGLRKLEIPEGWIFTYGPVTVGGRNDGNSPNVLRLYEDSTKKNLLAVYRDVISISDTRVQLTERKVKKKTHIYSNQGPNKDQQYVAEVRKTDWVNPFADEPEAEADEGILQLPSSMDDDL